MNAFIWTDRVLISFFHLTERKKADYDTCKISDEVRQLLLIKPLFLGVRWTQKEFLGLIFWEGNTLSYVFASFSMLQLVCRYIPTLHAILANKSGTFMEQGSRSSEREICVSIYGITNTKGVNRVDENMDC